MQLEIQWQEHDLGSYPTIVLTWEDAMRGAPWEYIVRCEESLTAYENGAQIPHRWPDLSVVLEDDDEYEDVGNAETARDSPASSAKETNETKFADPEDVRRALERAKRLLAPSPGNLKEMPTTSKRVH